MDPTAREIESVFKLLVAVIFGGMSLIFWLANRRGDAQRLDELEKLEFERRYNPGVPATLSPLEQLRLDFSALFELSCDPRRRGELLEDVFNRVFALGEVSVGCPFERREDEAGGKIDTQVDGVIQLDANLYLVEIRWEEAALGVGDIQNHLELLSSGDEASPTRGIIVSFNGFTEQAIDAARAAIKAGHTIILCTLSDFTHMLAGEGHLDALLRTRINIATLDKNPYASYACEAPLVECEFV